MRVQGTCVDVFKWCLPLEGVQSCRFGIHWDAAHLAAQRAAVAQFTTVAAALTTAESATVATTVPTTAQSSTIAAAQLSTIPAATITTTTQSTTVVAATVHTAHTEQHLDSIL
jgi:hypothetical protein